MASDERLGKRKLYGWLRRLMRTNTLYAEHWRATLEHPANSRLRELRRQRRASAEFREACRQLNKSPEELDPDPPLDRPEYEIYRSLLPNVIHTAGGIEYAVEKLEQVLDKEQAWLDQHVRDRGPFQDGANSSVSGPHRDEIQYEFSNLLFWIKTLRERLKTKLKADDGKWLEIGGLLPALAEDGPATRKVRELHVTLNGVFEECRLANFVTHAGAMGAFQSSRILDGMVAPAIPDRPKTHIYLWQEFTYNDRREMRTVARSLHGAVCTFIDGLLTAFELASKEIERRRERQN